MSQSKIPKLCVVFDTNVLYTQVASDLVRASVKSIIDENSDHVDLNVEWHIPEVVIGERRFQMLRKASDLLPSLKKMESLLGHGFGIGEDTLEMHVDKAIDSSVKQLGATISICDTTKVNWDDVIKRSVKRQPPFEDNDKEKGFRDAVIGNTFLQLCDEYPTTPTICKLALVSDDERLRDFVKEMTLSAKNVRILSNVDELENLINTLVSEISEDFAEELAAKASKLFFEKENERTFYYKQGIGDRIREKFSETLDASPIEGLLKDTSGKTWWIMNPVFMRKDKSRIYWTTSVQPDFELYHYEKSSDATPNPYMHTENSEREGLLSTLLGSGRKVVDYTGRDMFEVHWSANLSQAKNLTSPRLEKIVYAGNNLSEQ